MSITEYKRHTGSSKLALSLIENMSSNSNTETIAQNLQDLSKTLISLRKSDSEDKAVYKLPIIGGLLKNAASKHNEERYKNSKNIIKDLSDTLNSKTMYLVEDDKKIEHAIREVAKDIENNKKSLEALTEKLESIPGDNESELSDTEKTTIVGRIDSINKLISEQNIQLASLKILKHQNVMVIEKLKGDIDGAIISLTTSVFIDTHLKARKELMELSQQCTKASAMVLTEISNEIKNQTDEFHSMIANGSGNVEELENAINITTQTCKNIEDFNNNVLPDLISKINASVEAVTTLESNMDKVVGHIK